MLGELHDFAEGTMAIGRLDENSEGLLLLTTDGKESERIRSAEIEKEYYAQVLGMVTEAALARVRNGVEIGFSGKKYRTRPCQAEALAEEPTFSFPPKREHASNHGPTSWVSITLREGKYRQVRKSLAAVGHPVIRLVRVRIGRLQLENLPAGQALEVEFLAVS